MTTNYWKQSPLLLSVRTMTEPFFDLPLILYMPAFFLYYERGELYWHINGLCSDPDVDVAILVHL